MSPARKRDLIEMAAWGLASVFLVIVRALYYERSHGLTSDWMGEAWIAPLALALFYGIMALCGIDLGPYADLSLDAGLSTLCVYFLLRGIYEMANVASALTPWFLHAAIAFLVLGALAAAAHIWKKRGKSHP